MTEPTVETLARRLDRVERENRWLKRAGVVALAVIAAVMLMGLGKAPPEATAVVEANRFILKDFHRRVRAELGPIRYSFGWDPGLTFYDREGNEVAQLAANRDDAVLLLGRDSEEHRRGAAMMVTPSETKLILFYKNDAADLILLPDRGVALRLDGKEMLTEKYEKPRAELALQAEDNPRLTLSNKDGKVIWSVPWRNRRGKGRWWRGGLDNPPVRLEEALDRNSRAIDAVVHRRELGMSPGHGHRSEHSSHGIHGLLAPDLLPLRGMARAAQKPSNERGRDDPRE